MPEWLMQLLGTLGGLGLIAAAVRGVFNRWIAKVDAAANSVTTDKKTQAERIEKLEGKVESLLHDAVAGVKELNAQLLARIDMDEKQNTVLTATAQALADNARIFARIESLLGRLLEGKA